MSPAASALKERITDDMKSAMRSREKQRLLTIRLILAAIKQREVDDRCELDDSQIIPLLDKMSKQRRESIEQYQKAGRKDLEEQEQFELKVIQEYLPAAFSKAEIESFIGAAISSTNAGGIRDMGKVMAVLKPELLGRADLSTVSARVKTLLS